MKYYILNRQEVKNDIWVNPIIIRTKCLSKINKIKSLRKKLKALEKAVTKDLFELNAGMTQDKMEMLIEGETKEEITRADYNALLPMCLYETQEQRIRACNKSQVLKGRLYGNEIR